MSRYNYLLNLTVKQLSSKLRKKEISSVELTKKCLAEIKKTDKKIHAFLSVDEDGALLQAKNIDEKISAGEDLSPLAGIPIAIKDNILVEGLPCTAGSKILENYIAPYDATVIKRLKSAGAIILGKTNLDEFAMGSSTENSAFGPTKNPCDLLRAPGGSSGGSAAAVAANYCPCALGSDTGGSVRQPASFCGVVGMKPSYGAVSRYGLMAMVSSFDQIGPLAKNVEDAELVYNTISGHDKYDSTAVKKSVIENCKLSPPWRDPAVAGKIENLRIGVPNEYFAEGLDPKIEEMIRALILKLEKAGAKISGVSLPHTKYALPCYYILMPAEVSSNLARYDGVKYGANVAGDNLLETYLKTRGEKFGAEAKRRIILGTFALSAGYYDAYYLKAQKVRALIKKDFDCVFEKVDILITPTTPTTAFKLGEKNADPLAMYLSDIFTAPANLAGIPALSMPIGEIHNLPASRQGLPVGLQVIGKQFGEKIIFEAGKIIEKI